MYFKLDNIVVFSAFDGMSCGRIALKKLNINVKKYFVSKACINRIVRKGFSIPKINPNKSGCINTKNNSAQLSLDSGTIFIISDRGVNKNFIIEKNKISSSTSHDGCSFDHLVFDKINKIKSEKDKTSCLTVGGNSGGNNSDMDLILDNNKLRRLTPIECSRLQTIPYWYKWIVSDSQIYKMLGNGWTVDIIAHILSFLPIKNNYNENSKD